MLGLEVLTRFMTNIDFDRVVEIDYSSGGAYSLGPDDLFKEWKGEGINSVGMVALDRDDFILGFCLYNLDDREFYEIKHLVVDKAFQRLGVATSIINRMKGKLNNHRNALGCNVCEDNLACQFLLRKMGFKSKLIRRYDGDIIRFEYEV